ncbi:dynamin family protein [Escherichia coli]|uniref:Dynamin family protein n=1 Tax=Escherichia coli TaxID=562 RepID=A0A2X6FJ06_ECOLX|nr:dynamin family protein [Escherichia coli]QMF66342.1 dynamin family protein [Escherichia coli]QMF71536.1 dynamin family protein [Escherichia coli]QMG96855.1 dynamin family protein [Escherichia coli]SQM83911.1 Predicted GTPase [Escherichia coli]SQM88457.1 Predicted GTPase [Escherichia coli]
MNEYMLREDFLTSFQQLQEQFDSSLNDAKALDAEFIKHYHQFNSELSVLLADARTKVPQDSPLSSSLVALIEGLEKQDNDWKNKIQNQDKGLRFRKEFEDSLLVYVYGKVKSGKSSLGNYIAWGHTNPTPEQQSAIASTPHGKKVVYKTYENSNAENGDAQNEAEQQAKFRVSAIEATSSIQTFRLPGLTWVDSPGLHSVRTENAELAKEFVEHADLILYTMSSDSPGRASDLKEIQVLNNKEKNIMFLLTGSDTNEVVSKDAGEPFMRRIMKSTQTQQQQRDYVKNALEKENIDISNVEILSISAMYAEMNADNPEAIKESGMGQFFARLYQLSQSDGVRMKRAVPVNNFKIFLDICIREIEEYHGQMDLFHQNIKKLDESLKKTKESAILEAQRKMRGEIQKEFFGKLAEKRNSETQVNSALKVLKSTLDSRMEEYISCALDTILTNVVKEFKATITKTWQAAPLSLPSFSIEKAIEQIPDDYVEDTRGRNSRIGALLGSAVGFALGGFAGAAIGAGIGSGLGAMSGDNARCRMLDIEVPVGDNLNELCSHVLGVYNEGIEKEIQQQVDTYINALYRDMDSLYSALEKETEKFKTSLLALKKRAEDTLIR